MEKNVFSRPDDPSEYFPVKERPDEPSAMPSSAPTTLEPTNSPIAPVIPPTAAPIVKTPEVDDFTPKGDLPNCSELDALGETREHDEKQEITFLYEVQTTLGQSVDSVNNVILPGLEDELRDLLLRSWLDGIVCRASDPVVIDDRQGTEDNGDSERAYTIQDIDTAPVDTIRPGLEGGKYSLR